MADDKKRRKNKKKKNKQNKHNVDIGVGETVIRDHNLVNNNGKDQHVSLSETADNSIVDRETGNGDHNLVSNGKDQHVSLSETVPSSTGDHNLMNSGQDEHASLSETATDLTRDGETDTIDQNLVSNAKDEHANLSDDALNSVMDRETGNRDHNLLVNDAKDEDANTSEAVVNSNGDGESSTRDQNQVNNGKEDSSEFFRITHGQSVSEDWDCDWNWDAEVPNKDLNVEFNGHLPNGKKCDISDETIRKLKEENARLIQRENISEKTIQILTEEIDTHIRKEVMSLKIIRKLNEENHMHIQKEAKSEETIRKLNEQTDMHVQKEVALEENIRKLKKELDMHVKNEAALEEIINNLQTENELQKQKQTVLQLSSETPKDIPEIIFPTSDQVEPSPKQMSIQQGTVSLPSQSSILTEAYQLKDDEVDISQTSTEIETGNMQLSVENDILPQTSRPMALVVEDNLIVEAEIVSTTQPDDKEVTASDVKETKEADTDTVSRSIYSNDQLEELVSRLAAPVHLSSPISALSSSALSQNPNVQKISEVMQKLKVLVGKDLDSIMSTTGGVGEISSLLKYLDEIKDHLSPVDFGTFSAVQMVVGCFESDFPNIKLALSNYHDVHQEQQGVLGCIQELIQRRTDVNDKHEELNQRKQQITNRINGLQHDLQEAEKELATVLTEMDINAASGKDIESKINEECPKGARLMTKMSSIEADYHFALAKKASLAEDWANIQACFLSKSI